MKLFINFFCNQHVTLKFAIICRLNTSVEAGVVPFSKKNLHTTFSDDPLFSIRATYYLGKVVDGFYTDNKICFILLSFENKLREPSGLLPHVQG
jgi:hypothetical protein